MISHHLNVNDTKATCGTVHFALQNQEKQNQFMKSCKLPFPSNTKAMLAICKSKTPLIRELSWVSFAWTWLLLPYHLPEKLIFQKLSYRACILWGISGYVNARMGSEILKYEVLHAQLYCLSSKNHWPTAGGDAETESQIYFLVLVQVRICCSHSLHHSILITQKCHQSMILSGPTAIHLGCF